MEFFEKKEPNRLHRITEWAVDCAVMIALACYLVFERKFYGGCA